MTMVTIRQGALVGAALLASGFVAGCVYDPGPGYAYATTGGYYYSPGYGAAYWDPFWGYGPYYGWPYYGAFGVGFGGWHGGHWHGHGGGWHGGGWHSGGTHAPPRMR
jgi:hypothetical protein